MRLTPNFTLEELKDSDTAKRLGINNEPGEQQIECLRQLAENILQPLRTYFARPVTIRSGYRGTVLNHAVGGAGDSQHMRGQAADITIHGVGNDIIWQYIVDNLPFDQVILEHVRADSTQTGWVHCSYVPNGRRDAISCPSGGHYVKGLRYAS